MGDGGNATIDELHDAGRRLRQARKLYGWGVDGVFTDFPDLTLRYLESSR